jgi:hypothetical protein
MGRGFQAIQGGIASSTERGVAGLAAKGLDALGPAMLAIANERMSVSIGDPAVPALQASTSETFSVYAFGGSSAAFHLEPGAHRPRRWASTRRGSGGESTSRTIVWGAGLEQTVECAALGPSPWMRRLKRKPAKTPKKHQTEEDHEQEPEDMKGHTILATWSEEHGELFKSKDKQGREKLSSS